MRLGPASHIVRNGHRLALLQIEANRHAFERGGEIVAGAIAHFIAGRDRFTAQLDQLRRYFEQIARTHFVEIFDRVPHIGPARRARDPGGPSEHLVQEVVGCIIEHLDIKPGGEVPHDIALPRMRDAFVAQNHADFFTRAGSICFFRLRVSRASCGVWMLDPIFSTIARARSTNWALVAN